MDEQEASGLGERLEPRRERVEVEELGARHAQAGKPVRRLAGGERNDAAAGRPGQFENSGLPRLDQLVRLVRRQGVDPERRLQRDDRAVEP